MCGFYEDSMGEGIQGFLSGVYKVYPGNLQGAHSAYLGDMGVM